MHWVNSMVIIFSLAREWYYLGQLKTMASIVFKYEIKH